MLKIWFRFSLLFLSFAVQSICLKDVFERPPQSPSLKHLLHELHVIFATLITINQTDFLILDYFL